MFISLEMRNMIMPAASRNCGCEKEEETIELRLEVIIVCAKMQEKGKWLAMNSAH
jgi:hypothetical protein